MTPTSVHGADDPGADPFAEHVRTPYGVSAQVLGALFHFVSNSKALLAVVEAAFGGLPAQHLPLPAVEFRIELRLQPAPAETGDGEPPPVRTHSGGGLLCGVVDAHNYMVLQPRLRRGLVVVSEDRLAQPYHLRYELVEFATYVLASRGLGLVPLHAACVGRERQGVLLLGPSGAGKSTLTLHSVMQGLELLAEDAVLVHNDGLLATGLPSYLHMRTDGLGWASDEVKAWLEGAPRIRRRSGVEKFEIDLRHGQARLASAPLAVSAVVFVSAQPASTDGPLQRVPVADMLARLTAEQPYAVGQPGWPAFCRAVARVPGYELRRAGHPAASVQALTALLDSADALERCA